jgi:hypothetical protein
MIQRTFFAWASSGIDWDRPPYEACSPNLVALQAYLDQRWPGGQYLGCEGDRPIRAGVTPSEHSWGAALDWRYPVGTADAILRFLIDNSAELGVCRIHDYLRARIWTAGRTPNIGDAHTLWWKPNTGPGMGEAWADYFHIVTTLEAFGWSQPVAGRIALPPPIIPPVEEVDMLIVHRRRTHPDWDAMIWSGTHLAGARSGVAIDALRARGVKEWDVPNDEEMDRVINSGQTTNDCPPSMAKVPRLRDSWQARRA